MTIRQRIRRRVLIGYAIFLASFVTFYLVKAGAADRAQFQDWVWLTFVPIVAAFLWMNLAIRCPRCGGNLGTTPAAFPFSFSKKRRFNYCLYCGVSVDEPVEAR
jgi:hypothetical protein